MGDIDRLLQPYQRFGVHLGLERIERLLARMGNPEREVPFIHVAGTNGKGSVCAYLSAALVESGYRVGLYTSPHLLDWTERIQIDNRPISVSDFVAAVERAIAAIDRAFEAPTLFEIVTAAAWGYFCDRSVDIAVVEVGLGGRLDATNVAPPVVAAIASVARDHWQRLGDTLAQIAAEKAGILKPGRPAVVAAGQSPEVIAVIRERALALGCPLHWSQTAEIAASDRVHFYRDLKYVPALLGEVQAVNSAVAIDVLQLLQARGWEKIATPAIVRGMAAARWPGRLQWIVDPCSRRWLLDGAHNVSAAISLRRYADSIWPNCPKTWLIGMLATKDWEGVLSTLLSPGDRAYFVPVAGHQTVLPTVLARFARQHYQQLLLCQSCTDLATAVVEIKSLPANIEPILCGSLYLVGQFLRDCYRP